MAQTFWEQIRNELPSAGEFLTGSLNVSGSFSTSGSLEIHLDGVDDIFSVNVNGQQKVKVGQQGVLQYVSQSTTPTPIEGGIFYSSSNDYFFGFSS